MATDSPICCCNVLVACYWHFEGSGCCDWFLLSCLKAFQTHLEVSNYALQKEDPEETRELETVKQLRRLELAESKVCMYVCMH